MRLPESEIVSIPFPVPLILGFVLGVEAAEDIRRFLDRPVWLIGADGLLT